MSLKSKEKQGKNNNEERKILTKKITLNKLQKISLSIVSSIVLIAFVLTLIFFVRKNNSKSLIKGNTYVDPELARAMTYEQFEPGDENVEGTDNVKFSAFFLRDLNGDGYAEKIKGTCKEISSRDTLYMEINVLTEGRLNNAKIEIDGKNFNLATALPKDQQIKNNAISLNTKEIEFNDLLNGTQKLLSGIVTFSSVNNNVNNYTRNDNKIILTGTYVDENGTETEIRKEVNLTTDWYGTTRTIIEDDYQNYHNMYNYMNEENETIDLFFSVKTKEKDEKLVIAKNHVEATIPDFNGYKPNNVIVTNSNVDYNFNFETSKLTIDRAATVDNNGNITKTVARENTYTVKVQYPIAAFNEMIDESVELLIPIEEYYDGFNNQNTEFTNPYKSNVASKIIRAVYYRATADENYYPDSLSVTIGKYIYDPYMDYVVSKDKPMKIYNGVSSEENDDIYPVRWYYYRGNIGENEKIILKEKSDDELLRVDNFLDASGIYTSMEEVTSNKGIYFSDLSAVLEENGEIKVYDDENGDLLLTIDKTNINKYISRQFYYEHPVKHVRVEITGMNQRKSLYIYHIKELDDEYITNRYTEEEFNNLKQIRTTLTATKGETLQGTVSRNALYELPTSVARISLSKNVISTQETEKNDLIKISAEYNSSENIIGWTNGVFLVRLPNEILETEITDVTTNNSNIIIMSCEYYEDEQGKFIKIYTQNDKPEGFEINIKCNLTSDPRIPSVNRNLELYAINEEVTDYYYKGIDSYDVDNDLNSTEKVNKSTCNISIVAPNSLLTNQTLSEFDEDGTVVVSPNVADISPKIVGIDNDEKTATIGVQIKNSYSSDISEVVVIGKIPFEGNTSVLTDHDLGSSFTTRMLNTGIEIPQNLQGQVDIYYSNNENPTKDLTDENNNWKKAENIENWAEVRSFLIDFKEAILNPTDEYIFYYKVAIPNGLNYNVASYSHHGIWFALNTDQGKYRTQTEPTKTGIRIADKYRLELTKYQKNKNKNVSGATYRIAEVNENNEYGNIKTGVTFSNGKISITGLYVEQEYEIREIKTSDEYELNEDVVRFICHVNEDGELQVEKKIGETRDDFTVIRDEEENQVVTVSVEDEAKASLKLIKYEKDTQNKIGNVRYKITGSGLPVNGKVIRTDINGEATVKGLNIGTEYTLEETKAEGYYLNEPITFTITNNNGTYGINVTGNNKGTSVTINNEIPTIQIELEDEKIPTYNLQINKIEKGSITEEHPNGIPIVGAKFDLYKGNIKQGTYMTDEQGHIYIENLYQYEEVRGIDQNYKLLEIYAPEGYAKTSDIEIYAKTVTEETDITDPETEEIITNTITRLELEQILGEGQNPKSYTVDNNTIILSVEDLPSFKLIKKDGETNELLPNTKFAIYNVENGMTPAIDSKGEIVGTREIIDGKEYYTLTTDINGQISADLPEGLYNAVEIVADEKYDTSNSTYFGIGKSYEGKKTVYMQESAQISNALGNEIISTTSCSDNGFLACGNFHGLEVNFGNGVVAQGTADTLAYSCGMLVKYDENLVPLWSFYLKGNYSSQIADVVETTDGNYVAVGYYAGTTRLSTGTTISR